MDLETESPCCLTARRGTKDVLTSRQSRCPCLSAAAYVRSRLNSRFLTATFSECSKQIELPRLMKCVVLGRRSWIWNVSLKIDLKTDMNAGMRNARVIQENRARSCLSEKIKYLQTLAH